MVSVCLRFKIVSFKIRGLIKRLIKTRINRNRYEGTHVLGAANNLLMHHFECT